MSARCFKFSRAWHCRCELEEGHAGYCVSAGDGFYGYDLRFETPEGEKIDDPKWVARIEEEYGEDFLDELERELKQRGKRR